MNKIFLVITLCFLNYGLFSTEKNRSEITYTSFGFGNSDCSAYLDTIDDGFDNLKEMFIAYSQGVSVTQNAVSALGVELFEGKQFVSKGSMLERLITKYCEENVSANYHVASTKIWFENAK